MKKQVKYKFNQLPVAAQKHVRLFQVHQFLTWGGLGIGMVIFVLLLQDRGFDLFEISLVTMAFSASTLLFELPLGGLADGIGRKPVYIVSIFAEALSLIVLLGFHTFTAAVLAYAIYGVSRALMSGTLDAWFVEKFNALAPNFGTLPVLAKIQFSSTSGLAVGAVFGGLMADYFGPMLQEYGFSLYDAPLFGNLLVTLFMLVFTLIFIKEKRHAINRAAIKAGFANVPHIIKDSLFYATKHQIVSLLLIGTSLFSLAFFTLETFWIPFIKPMLEGQYIVSLVGLITAAYFGSMAIGAAIAASVVNLFNGSNIKALIFGVFLTAICLITLAFSQNIYFFVPIFILLNIALGAQGAPEESLFHDYVPDNKRSTLLSLQSVVMQLGGLIGMLCLGYIAETLSISTAWKIAGIIILLVTLIYVLLLKRLNHTPQLSQMRQANE